MCIEIMLNAVNLTLIAFNRWQPAVPRVAAETLVTNPAHPPSVEMNPHHGQIFAFMVIAIAAAEAAVGLAIGTERIELEPLRLHDVVEGLLLVLVENARDAPFDRLELGVD